MTLTADLHPAVPAVSGDRLRRWWRTSRGTGVVTGGDVLRLTATLVAVGGLVGALDLATPQAPAAGDKRVLETSYGVVALGHVSVEAAGPSATELGGTQRVTVPVTLHNLSDRAVHYGPQHFRLRTGSTTARPEAGSVRTGDVSPDSAVQLRLVFDVPSTAPRARLTVDDARLTSGLRVVLPAPDATR